MKNNLLTKMLAAGMAAALLLAGCGGSDTASNTPAETAPAAQEQEAEASTEEAAADDAEAAEEETETVKENPYDALPASFKYFTSGGVDEEFFSDYREAPAVKYWLGMDWDSDGNGTTKKLEMEFVAPAAGTERDNFNTLIATEEYYDVMDLSYATEGPASLYEQGVALDLTELVETYMPNYMQYMKDHPDLEKQMRNDGKIIAIYAYSDAPDTPFAGWEYRRDWILKYGKDEDGKAFTGGWNEDHSKWEDDIVFPSGNVDPITITDWEWMFEIFETAMKDLGIEDGYVFQMYYPGYYQMGDLMSGFGGGAPNEYITEDGDVKFGATEDGMRAYLECMNAWYEKGWMDQSFEENTSDMFFRVDTPTVYSGHVGCWMGGKATLGYGIYVDDNPALEEVCVYGCASPINDKYGDKSVQGTEPRAFYQTGNAPSNCIIVTNKAEEKDIPTLLTALDYLYSHDGGMLRQYGLSDKIQAEVQDPFLIEHDLAEGVWYEDEEDGETIYRVHGDKREAIDGLSTALCISRVVGMKPMKNVDLGRTSVANYSLNEMRRYIAVGQITSIINNQVSPDDAATVANIKSQINTYLAMACGDFITGRKDIESDADWQAYCDEVNNFSPETIEDIYNVIMEKLK